MSEDNGKQAHIDHIREDIREVKGMVQRLFDKIDVSNQRLATHCVSDHKKVDAEIAAVKTQIAYYVGGGVVLITILNIGVKIFF